MSEIRVGKFLKFFNIKSQKNVNESKNYALKTFNLTSSAGLTGSQGTCQNLTKRINFPNLKKKNNNLRLVCLPQRNIIFYKITVNINKVFINFLTANPILETKQKYNFCT